MSRLLNCFLSLVLFSLTVFANPPFPIIVQGGDESSFYPEPRGRSTQDRRRYDVIIVGGGLAGLSAAVYLTDHRLRVLVLEKENDLGGLASGGSLQNGIRFDRGAAYWTDSYEEEQRILEHIGLGNFREHYRIPEPIDSYLWNGTLYEGVWEHATLARLPASFELFANELRNASREGLIPNQPFEESANLELDRFTAAEWIRDMPDRISRRTDPDSTRISQRYRSENPPRQMEDVIDFLNLYSRSALGTTTEEISAVAFANFYISELEVRFTSTVGTGVGAQKMERILRSRPHRARLLTGAAVSRIRSDLREVRVTYVRRGTVYRARAKYVVFAAQMSLAPHLIQGFSGRDPERARILSRLRYSHYAVHAVQVQGHPYRASYDTWVRASDAKPDDFTDVILGRWMDPQIAGYEGMRDFARSPSDPFGILTIYHPLGSQTPDAISEATATVQRMVDIFNPVLQSRWGQTIQVNRVYTHRWPYSVHIAAPGHFLNDARRLRRPSGRIFFANNNLGTPSFEEALFRGHCAANNILRKVKQGFRNEPWSHCPIEN